MPVRSGSRRGPRIVVVTLAAVLLLAGTVLAVHRADQSDDHSGPRPPVDALRVINYYPADDGWTRMWTDYSHARTVADFRTIAGLHANAVRVFVHPYTFGYPEPTRTMRDHLDDLLDTARSLGLKVQLSLFDMWGDYPDLTGSRTWVRELLGPHRNDSTIALVELRNELPVDDPAGVAWAHAMLPELARVLPGVPRTLSIAGASRASAVRAFFGQFPASELDVVSVHWYGPVQDLPDVLDAAHDVARGRPVLVGELGYSTLPEAGASGETAQAEYYAAAAKLLTRARLPPFAPWILSDFVAGTVPGRGGTQPREYHFGLRRLDGTEKPTATVVRQMYSAAAR